MGDNRNAEVIVTLVILESLCIFFTALRVYVRIFLSKNWGIDDSLLITTLILFTAWSLDRGVGIKVGAGRHFEDIPTGDISHALFTCWFGELLYILTTITLRLSIAVFLLRVCFRRAHKMIIYCTMAMITIFSTFYLFLAIFQCCPVTYFWTQDSGETGTCMDKHIFSSASYAHSAVSATADFILGILPVWIIWDLKMNLRTKISVGVVLSLGIIAGIGALIRVPYIGTFSTTNDFLYATIDVAIWSSVEVTLGIIATAACALRPLFKSFYDRSSQGGSYGHPEQRFKGKKNWPDSRNVGLEQGLELGQSPAGPNRTQGVVATADLALMSDNFVGASGKEKKVNAFMTKPVNGSTSSLEELTTRATGGGIQVQRTVEVVNTYI